MTLHEQRNGPYFALFHRIFVYAYRRKKFTFAISSPDEFLYIFPAKYMLCPTYVLFDKHISDKVNKAYMMLGIIKRNFAHLSRKCF